jgi:1-acyl-sn-glycerol-3-phosphate acyltransferase
MPTDQKRRRPPIVQFGQAVVRFFFRILFTLFYRIRVHGLENYPAHDGMLVCLNHQSNLDPLIAGVICPRPVNYLGKHSLFTYAPMAWFFGWNDTIAIDREAGGIGGMKETLRRIKRGESVAMFPEGTRCPDGEIHSLKLGFCSVAKRTKSTLMPIGFDGAFQAYPRTQILPRAGRIHAVMGQPIPFEEYESLADQELADLLELRIRECFNEARVRWQASQGMVR